MPSSMRLLAFAFTLIPFVAVAQAENYEVQQIPDTFSPPSRAPKRQPEQAPLKPIYTPPSESPFGPPKGQWQSRTFPAPNGGLLVFEVMSNGNPACATYNGRDCLWGRGLNQIDFKRVQPLTCGADHRAKWGVTGYEDPKHWCSLAKK